MVRAAMVGGGTESVGEKGQRKVPEPETVPCPPSELHSFFSLKDHITDVLPRSGRQYSSSSPPALSKVGLACTPDRPPRGPAPPPPADSGNQTAEGASHQARCTDTWRWRALREQRTLQHPLPVPGLQDSGPGSPRPAGHLAQSGGRAGKASRQPLVRTLRSEPAGPRPTPATCSTKGAL